MNNEWWINLAKLDQDQQGILTLPLDEDHVIFGPPGSGKTNLLLLRANYVSQTSPNILVVVFGRTLREFLARGAGQYNFDIERLKTSAKCFYDILRDYGREAPDENLPFEEARKELVERVRSLRADLSTPPYDAIFLDEAQDFSPDELNVFRSLSKRFFAVADSRQQLYRGGASVEHLETISVAHRLRFHYRNGFHICQLADSIGERMTSYSQTLPTCRYDEDRMPSTFEWIEADFDSQVGEITTRLDVQLKAFPNELLAVICPKNSDVHRMHSALLSTRIGNRVMKQSSADGYGAFDNETPVCITTMHGCKGLEFRAVHGAMMESVRKFPLQRNLVFTLTTRAKTSLTIYGDPIPPFLLSAVLSIRPPKDLPPISRAFGADD